MSAFRSHGEANAAVAEEGLIAITNLSTGNAANRTRLGEAGACEGVVTHDLLVCCGSVCYRCKRHVVFSLSTLIVSCRVDYNCLL